jgi:biotin transport system substrate-specific component
MSLHSGSLRTAVFPRSTAVTEALFVVGGIGFISLLAQISLPVPGSPVPVTGQTLAVLLIGTTYGARLGLITFASYLLAGIAGAPIFAPSATSANHGIDRIVGATGGYLVGMLVASFVLGYLADRKADLTWLHASLDLTWAATFKAGFTPFILGEVLKIAITATSLPLVWRRISRSLNR